MKTGVQLYTFRDALAQDFAGTLREIAKIGFDGVEFFPFYGSLEPEALAALLKDLRLECAGTMFKEKDLLSGEGRAYEYARTLNSPAVTVSMFLDFAREYPAALSRMEAIGAAAAEHRYCFSYHNHWAEFAELDGRSAMEQILDHTDGQNVFWEPDVCWITRGGGDAPSLIRKYASRIRQVHLKDAIIDGDSSVTTALGRGVVPVADCLHAARQIQAQWCIYEQDYSDDPFRDAAESLRQLH